MFEDPEIGGGERVAVAIAERVGSWPFVLGVLVAVTAWVIVNVAWEPFEPYPVIMFAVLSGLLATLAALQGPLILITQRRAADRDRARDREVLMVSANSESDLHRVESKVDQLIARVRD